MLNYLFIENVAVIEKAEINFKNGFNIMTGETGAGKSIIIDSINAILGNRTSKELIRTGAESAFISAVFSDFGKLPEALLLENGYSPDEDGNVILQREIKSDGKNICKICGRPASVSILKEIATSLISIQGQHESYELLSENKHIGFIDAFGELSADADKYRESYKHLKQIGKELDAVETNEEEKSRKIDILNFQINELEAANIKEGEREELALRKNKIINIESIAKAVKEARERIDTGTFSAVENISEAAASIEKAGKILPEFEKLSEKLRDIEYELKDCAETLRENSEDLDFNENELNEIEERLDALFKLSQKYGSSEKEMLEFLEKIKNELNSIQKSDEIREQLSLEFETAKTACVELAKALSLKRRETSSLFEKKVMDELKFLDMPNVVFSVHRERCPLNLSGCDEISFLISVNPGESLKPISKVASGGELSRIMLAIKTVLSGKGDTETLIFDEVDSGISGSAAQKVGKKLKETSKNVQVICVTHLAQIAALADSHYLIEKNFTQDKTYTDVKLLSFEERKAEISRMIGGSDITETMLKNAEEMLIKGSK